jgi:hypothetical protein
MKAESGVEGGQGAEPAEVSADFSGFGVPIITVEVDAGCVLPLVEFEAGGIEAGTDPEAGVGGPLIRLEELEDGERACRFIAMDPRREVDTAVRLRCDPGKGGKADSGTGLEPLEVPSMASGGPLDGVECSWERERFPVIAALVKPERLRRYVHELRRKRVASGRL